jgi:hypothetical protein
MAKHGSRNPLDSPKIVRFGEHHRQRRHDCNLARAFVDTRGSLAVKGRMRSFLPYGFGR